MLKILKNYKKLGSSFEEFELIRIRDDEDIFVDMPICVCDYDRIYEKPVIVNAGGVFPLCLELDDLKEQIKDTKIFHLDVIQDGRVIQAKNEKKATIHQRLKKDVDLESLIYENGVLRFVQEEQKQEPKEEGHNEG